MKQRIEIAQKRGQPGVPASAWDAVLKRLRTTLAGEYRVRRELGRGGQAAVFLADELTLERRVAIKVLAPGSLADDEAVRQFRREAQTIANLKHPHIVTIFSVRQIDGLRFFVMQYIEGPSLAELIAERGQLPLTATRAVAFQVGSALQYAHRRNVIHRDIKPANVLFDEEGNAILTDFGVAQVLSPRGGQRANGPPMGTPAYMSPEHSSPSLVTWASDQYSLGALLYEMLTGRVPFDGPTLADALPNSEREPQPIRNLRADCPVELEWAVMRMLARKPEDRWPSLASALSSVEAAPLSREDPIREELRRLAIEGEKERGVSVGPTGPAPWRPLPSAGENSSDRDTQEVPNHPLRRARLRRRRFSLAVVPAIILAVVIWRMVTGSNAPSTPTPPIPVAAAFGPAAASAISGAGYSLGAFVSEDFADFAPSSRADARDGRLYLVDQSFSFAPAGWTLNARDFAAHVDVQYEGGDAEQYGGLFFRRGETAAGTGAAYFLVLRGSATPGFGLLYNDGNRYTDVLAKTASPALRAGHNAVDLVVIGDTLTVFLNDIQVAATPLGFSPGGGFGVFSEQRVNVSFDNLVFAALQRE